MSVPILSGKAFLLVSGASKGIGRQIAESFAPLLGEGSSVLLLARNASGLQGTIDKLPKGLKVHAESVDLSTATADELRGNFFQKQTDCELLIRLKLMHFFFRNYQQIIGYWRRNTVRKGYHRSQRRNNR